MPLCLSNGVQASLEKWVRSGYPYETCGLLIGKRQDGLSVAKRAALAENLNKERAEDRYELAPRDLLAADIDARASGLEIIGVWHSHPDHPARPSETDRQMAWTGWSYLIISVNKERVQDLRAWRLNSQGEFDEEPIQP